MCVCGGVERRCDRQGKPNVVWEDVQDSLHAIDVKTSRILGGYTSIDRPGWWTMYMSAYVEAFRIQWNVV